jgi:hypothetical protein
MKVGDTVFCIRTNKLCLTECLTEGKAYTVIYSDYSLITIIDDNDSENNFWGSEFITQDEHREKQLKKLLDDDLQTTKT